MIQTRPAEAPAVPAKTTRDVLLHAARYIEEFGWCQQTLDDDDGRVCALGALQIMTMGRTAGHHGELEEWFTPDFLAAERSLKQVVGEQVATFNDTPGRTAAEVIAALRAAADSA